MSKVYTICVQLDSRQTCYGQLLKKVFSVTEVTCFLKSSADQLLALNGLRFNYFWCVFFFTLIALKGHIINNLLTSSVRLISGR